MPTTAPSKTLPFAFDLQDALAPISADHPSGESLRYDELYDTIKELRREEDPALPQGVWKRELKRADWDRVAALAVEALETRTKDLQIAAWLLEAWIHLHGLPGVEQGLKLVTGLCEDFWDDIHPQIDDGLEFRLAPIEWLAGRLIFPLKTIAVTRPETDEAVPYAWVDWEAALHLTHLIKAEQTSEEEAEAQGKVTQAKFLASVSLTPTAFYIQLADQVDKSLAAVDGLAGLVEEKVGEAAPSFSELRGVIEAVGRYVDRNLQERMEPGEPLPGGEVESEPAALAVLEEEAEVVTAGGPITSRAEAYRRLNQAADYLLRTEPHSPAPYLVKRAVSWGHMSLAELLQELLEQNTDLRAVYKLLGIRHMDSS